MKEINQVNNSNPWSSTSTQIQYASTSSTTFDTGQDGSVSLISRKRNSSSPEGGFGAKKVRLAASDAPSTTKANRAGQDDVNDLLPPDPPEVAQVTEWTGYIKKARTAEPKNSIFNSLGYLGYLGSKLSIFARSIAKASVISYYYTKHSLLGVPVNSPEQLKAIINKLGPIFTKIIQPKFKELEEVEQLIKHELLKLPYQQSEFNEDETQQIKLMSEAVHEVINNCKLNDITMEKAQMILDNSFCGKYTVQEMIGSGTIASCYRVVCNSTGETYVAKIMSEEKADQVSVGINSLWFLNYLLPASSKTILDTLLLTFKEECCLDHEQANMIKYRKSLAEVENSSIAFTYTQEYLDETRTPEAQITQIPVEVSVSFSMPEVVDNFDLMKKHLIIMTEVGEYDLGDLFLDRDLFAQQFKKCFGRPPQSGINLFHSTGRPKVGYFEDELSYLGKALKQMVSDQWNRVMAKSGWVHGDLHSGNVRVSFERGRKINISFIDFGNSHQLRKSEFDRISEFVAFIEDSLKIKPDQTYSDIIVVRLRPSDIIDNPFKIIGAQTKTNNLLDVLQSWEVEIIKKTMGYFLTRDDEENLTEIQREILYRAIFDCFVINCRPGQEIEKKDPETRTTYCIDISRSRCKSVIVQLLEWFSDLNITIPHYLHRLWDAVKRGDIDMNTGIFAAVTDIDTPMDQT